jgi:hypothetical protein
MEGKSSPLALSNSSVRGAASGSHGALTGTTSSMSGRRRSFLPARRTNPRRPAPIWLSPRHGRDRPMRRRPRPGGALPGMPVVACVDHVRPASTVWSSSVPSAENTTNSRGLMIPTAPGRRQRPTQRSGSQTAPVGPRGPGAASRSDRHRWLRTGRRRDGSHCWISAPPPRSHGGLPRNPRRREDEAVGVEGWGVPRVDRHQLLPPPTVL